MAGNRVRCLPTCAAAPKKKAAEPSRGFGKEKVRRTGSRLVRVDTKENRLVTRLTSGAGLPTEWRMHCDSECPLFAEYLDHAASAGWEDLFSTEAEDISPGDALVVVDMQNDFLPVDDLNPAGGRMCVKEADLIVPLVVDLIRHFAASGASVVATRDFHPEGHCSFLESNGPFPTHCLQGSPGSHFYGPIGKCLQEELRNNRDVEIAFKGLHEDIDSFGAFEYPGDEALLTKLPHRANSCQLHGSSYGSWTGAFKLKCGNFRDDINANPNALAALDMEPISRSLQAKNVKRLFVCGVPFGCNVLDTALNAASHAGYNDVYIILDACRASHIPGVGRVGSGFLEDPGAIYKQIDGTGVKFKSAMTLLPMLVPSNPISATRQDLEIFPETLGPFPLVSAPQVSITVDSEKMRYIAHGPDDILSIYQSHGVECVGKTSPACDVGLNADGRRQFGIPDEAVTFCWVYPFSAGEFTESARGYLSLSRPSAAFFFFGGFAYCNNAGEVVAAKAVTVGNRGLHFDSPHHWCAPMTPCMKNRWQPVTFPFAKSAGARFFCFLAPGELLPAVSENGKKQYVNVGGRRGGFAFLFHDEENPSDSRDCYFPISEDICKGMREELTDMCVLNKIRRTMPDSADAARVIFEEWSGGADGLTVDRFFGRVSKLEDRTSEEQSSRLFAYADSNKDGEIGFKEFFELLTRIGSGRRRTTDIVFA